MKQTSLANETYFKFPTPGSGMGSVRDVTIDTPDMYNPRDGERTQNGTATDLADVGTANFSRKSKKKMTMVQQLIQANRNMSPMSRKGSRKFSQQVNSQVKLCQISF